MDQYSIIALCNFVYKVLNKVPANGLKQVIPDLIWAPQTAFFREIIIFEIILLAHEMLMKYSRKKGKKIFASSWTCKAFDKVRWSFVINTLVKMNFPDSW